MLFNAEKQQQLENILINFRDSDAMHIDEVRGFFTAMISGPDEANVADWMDVVLGSDIENYDSAQKEAAIALIEAMVTDIKEELLAKSFEKALVSPIDGNVIDGLKLWCNAYLYALDIVATDWFEYANNDADFEDLFYPVMALGGIYEEEGIEFDDKEMNGFANDLAETVQLIHSYLHALINKPKTQKRDGDKIGRNDMCSCGSEKKFKACCGKAK